MSEYRIAQKCLQAFSRNENINSQFDISAVEKFATKNKILSIIKYVCKIDNKTELNKNKCRHYQGISNCVNVFKKLECKAIPYAVIKGSYLDKTAYLNRGLRSSNDIDILIDRRNYKILCEILESEGFVCGYYDYISKEICKFSRKVIMYNYLYTHQAASYIKTVTTNDYFYIIKVDINFSISWGEDVSWDKYTAELLKNTREVEYEGLLYKVLNPELYLLQLCLHSYRDMNSIVLIYKNKYILRLLCDVYYYLLREIINIDLFIETVKKYGYERQAYYIFVYIKEFFGNSELIQYILDALGEAANEWISCFGLTEKERKTWNLSFKERIMSDNLFECIKPLLDDADINKVNSIMNNM